MLTTKIKFAIVLAAATLVPAIASAAPPVQTAAGERAQVKDVATDGWRYIGGEAGWLLEVHKLQFVGGQLVHAKDCPLEHALAKAPEVRDRGGNEPLNIGA